MTLSEQSDSRAIHRGRLAVAEVLRHDYLTEHETTEPVEAWMSQASRLIDAWLLASNPVGDPETIYDEYHRLREAARSALANLLDPIYDDENAAGRRIIDELRELVR